MTDMTDVEMVQAVEDRERLVGYRRDGGALGIEGREKLETLNRSLCRVGLLHRYRGNVYAPTDRYAEIASSLGGKEVTP